MGTLGFRWVGFLGLVRLKEQLPKKGPRKFGGRGGGSCSVAPNSGFFGGAQSERRGPFIITTLNPRSSAKAPSLSRLRRRPCIRRQAQDELHSSVGVFGVSG